MCSSSNNADPKWHCAGGEAISPEGACQARAGIRQHCPGQPDHTAINPSTGEAEGVREGCWVVANLGDLPAVAVFSTCGEGYSPPNSGRGAQVAVGWQGDPSQQEEKRGEVLMLQGLAANGSKLEKG